ncbi:hypothetical protein EV363DRAFT_1332174 [Boletus edulis]|nr:hypothetical protein EV363DRAFT_1332174 [Boletus edulis]
MASEEKVGRNDVTSLQARGQQLHPRSLFLTRRLDQPPLSLRPYSHHLGRRESQTDSDGRLLVDIPVNLVTLVSYGSITIRLSCPPIQSRNSMHPPGPEMSGVYASTYLDSVDTVQFSWPSRRLVGRTRWGWCLLERRVAHTSPSSIPSLQ